MRTIAISNYKGGVGKTTTAVNLASVFSSQGKRVLLIDLDPQASATDYYGLYDKAKSEGRTSVELLYGNATVEELAFSTQVDNLAVIPSTIELVDQNELLLREQRLNFALDDAKDDYDIAIIDCSPVLKRLAFNAYLASCRRRHHRHPREARLDGHARNRTHGRGDQVDNGGVAPSPTEVQDICAPASLGA